MFNKRFVLFSLLFFFIALLSSCTTVRKGDGPPPYDVDVSCIPNAVPQRVCLSKYGNKPRYQVFGKNYYVMSSAQNYCEDGVASWYGTKFHSRHTSSGERYNMLAMTAAHKTLPLPTYVKVTNLKNGRDVIVKVNDRGPFESNRLIDLSYVAAKKLGMLGKGTAYVRVQTVTPDDYNNPVLLAEKKSVHHRGVYLQVGAFRNRIYAERLKTRLTTMVPSPIAVTRLSRTSHHLYHVQIGPIRDVAAADQINKRLRSIGLKGKEIS